MSVFLPVLAPVIVCEDNPVVLGGGWVFRRATKSETIEIQAFLDQQAPQHTGRLLFEQGLSWRPRTPLISGPALPAESHRYCVVIPPSVNGRVDLAKKQDLEHAVAIADFHLDLSITIMPGGHSVDMGSSFWINAIRNPFAFRGGFFVGANFASDVPHCFDRIQVIQENDRWNPIYRSIQMFTNCIPAYGFMPFRLLGLFATLESAITHSPIGRGDTLGRQIASKLRLIENRVSACAPRMIGKSGGDCAQLWTNLYKIRSKLAHGESVDWRAEPARYWSNSLAVESYLERVCRCVLRFGLEEPQLLLDLKNC